MPNVLPTLRGKPEVVGKTALPAWMMHKDVDAKDQSVAGWIQRIKNTMFGGLQADIFEVCVELCSHRARHVPHQAVGPAHIRPKLPAVFLTAHVVTTPWQGCESRGRN